MLHKETVTGITLELIKSLQNDEYFKEFYLVGGTALALQIGHRTSIDIDFFSQNPFNEQQILEYLEKKYDFSVQYIGKNTLKGTAKGIFIDFITHDYPIISTPTIVENISMLSVPDIAAMKFNAISGNGTRPKDFIDMYFILKEYSLEELISFFSSKYGKRNRFHALKSLTYFSDIRPENWPNLILEKDLTFDTLKKCLIQHRDNYFKNLTHES